MILRRGNTSARVGNASSRRRGPACSTGSLFRPESDVWSGQVAQTPVDPGVKWTSSPASSRRQRGSSIGSVANATDDRSRKCVEGVRGFAPFTQSGTRYTVAAAVQDIQLVGLRIPQCQPIGRGAGQR